MRIFIILCQKMQVFKKNQDSDCFTPLAFRVSGDPDAFTGVTQDRIQVDMPKRTGRSNHVSEVMTLVRVEAETDLVTWRHLRICWIMRWVPLASFQRRWQKFVKRQLAKSDICFEYCTSSTFTVQIHRIIASISFFPLGTSIESFYAAQNGIKTPRASYSSAPCASSVRLREQTWLFCQLASQKRWVTIHQWKTNQPNLEAEAVFYALQTDLGLSLSDLATMTLIQAIGWQWDFSFNWISEILLNLKSLPGCDDFCSRTILGNPGGQRHHEEARIACICGNKRYNLGSAVAEFCWIDQEANHRHGLRPPGPCDHAFVRDWLDTWPTSSLWTFNLKIQSFCFFRKPHDLCVVFGPFFRMVGMTLLRALNGLLDMSLPILLRS